MLAAFIDYSVKFVLYAALAVIGAIAGKKVRDKKKAKEEA